ncbi:hypothetical protein GSH19_06290 [Lactobacillus sp. S2-2]|uniref:hypothetical protein n=1 Tax=Lactobacillus sp. S2-2 TaxID=2692917 RepID=UPI001F324BD7|nr:hypothetical protein [Lactobacillus sp. S2-2]MCF6515754.1 hypothetical protein [Lactobacillus sp. S2-2]
MKNIFNMEKIINIWLPILGLIISLSLLFAKGSFKAILAAIIFIAFYISIYIINQKEKQPKELAENSLTFSKSIIQKFKNIFDLNTFLKIWIPLIGLVTTILIIVFNILEKGITSAIVFIIFYIILNLHQLDDVKNIKLPSSDSISKSKQSIISTYNYIKKIIGKEAFINFWIPVVGLIFSLFLIIKGRSVDAIIAAVIFLIFYFVINPQKIKDLINTKN